MRNHSSYRFARKAASKDAGLNWRDSTDKYTKGNVVDRLVRRTYHQPHQGDQEMARRRRQRERLETHGNRAARRLTARKKTFAAFKRRLSRAKAAAAKVA